MLLESMKKGFERGVLTTHPNSQALLTAWWAMAGHYIDLEEVQPERHRASELIAFINLRPEIAQDTPPALLENPLQELVFLKDLEANDRKDLFMGRLLHQAELAKAQEVLGLWREAFDQHILPWAHAHAKELARKDRCEAAAFSAVRLLEPVMGDGPREDVTLSETWAAFINDAMFWTIACPADTTYGTHVAEQWLERILEAHPGRTVAYLNLADVLMKRDKQHSQRERTSRAFVLYFDYALQREHQDRMIPKRVLPYHGEQAIGRLREQLEEAMPEPERALVWPPHSLDLQRINTLEQMVQEMHAAYRRLKQPLPKSLHVVHVLLIDRLAAYKQQHAKRGWSDLGSTLGYFWKRAPASVRKASKKEHVNDALTLSADQSNACPHFFYRVASIPGSPSKTTP